MMETNGDWDEARFFAFFAVLVILVILLVSMGGAPVAQARTLTHGDMHSAGSHWCNWSITATCKRWKARGGKLPVGYCAGPNDMRSGCVMERRGIR
jgi:hypothetical protein